MKKSRLLEKEIVDLKQRISTLENNYIILNATTYQPEYYILWTDNELFLSGTLRSDYIKRRKELEEKGWSLRGVLFDGKSEIWVAPYKPPVVEGKD